MEDVNAASARTLFVAMCQIVRLQEGVEEITSWPVFTFPSSGDKDNHRVQVSSPRSSSGSAKTRLFGAEGVLKNARGWQVRGETFPHWSEISSYPSSRENVALVGAILRG